MRKAAVVSRTSGSRRARVGALMACTVQLGGRLAFAGGLVAAALSTTIAQADQGKAALVGPVPDASTRKPIQDGVVTVTSPSLQGEQMTVTDASGFYQIPGLPPGGYVLLVEKEGYNPYSASDIALHA